MRKDFCDRCEKEIENIEKVKISCNIHDLCEQCFLELMGFMFGNKTKKQRRK